MVARIASLETDQATERRHGISGIHEEHQVKKEVHSSRVPKFLPGLGT